MYFESFSFVLQIDICLRPGICIIPVMYVCIIHEQFCPPPPFHMKNAAECKSKPRFAKFLKESVKLELELERTIRRPATCYRNTLNVIFTLDLMDFLYTLFRSFSHMKPVLSCHPMELVNLAVDDRWPF